MIKKMIMERNNPILPRSAALALVLIVGLIATACGGATSGGAVPPSNGAATATPRSNQGNSKLDCQALANAAFDLNTNSPFLLTLAGGGGSVLNRVDSPFYVDTAKLRADLLVLAVLPDPTDAASISMMGKPSEEIPQWNQLLDLVDKDAGGAAGSTPVINAGTTDKQLLDFTAKIVQMTTAFNAAMDTVCPGATANGPAVQMPGAAATPLAAGYQIGQTAPVGDLRVSLDKVVSLAGSGGVLPTAGNRFVFVYITVENQGQNAFQTNMLSGTHWEDTGGKQYYEDPFSIGLDPTTTNLDGGLDPGAKKSGAIGYQLPMAGGDMVWVFKDFGPNQAVFAVKASDISSTGAPVTEATEVALRAQLDATQTAFVQLAEDADSVNATYEAAGTDTPVPTDTAAPTDVPAPTDPPIPTDGPAPTDAPVPTDAPAPTETTDAPVP